MGKEKFQTFALLLKRLLSRRQASPIQSCLFLSLRCVFLFTTRGKNEETEGEAVIIERRLCLKTDHLSNFTDSTSTSKTVLGKETTFGVHEKRR